MKKTFLFAATILALSPLFYSCKEETKEVIKTETIEGNLKNSEEITSVMTLEDQTKLTPLMVLDDLKAGNARFVNNKTTTRNYREQVKKTENSQYPKAYILSCIDSRIPVEDVFDQGIGDIFVGRVAGNFINTDQLGSMEFAAKVAGSKLLVIMGHKSCGAVMGAIDKAELGNLTSLLKNIQPAVIATDEPTEIMERTSKNGSFVDSVVENNVKLNIEKLYAQSPVLADMVENGELKVVGANYDLATGKVIFY